MAKELKFHELYFHIIANKISSNQQEESFRLLHSPGLLEPRLLCAFVGKNGKSVCKEPDDETLAHIISKVYLDRPSGHPYFFQQNPPKLDGQIGVPPIVDKLLGECITMKNLYISRNTWKSCYD